MDKKRETTFEEIRDILKSVSEKQDRLTESQDRLTESQDQLTESQKKTDRQMKNTDNRLKKLDELFTGQWGKLIEALVEGDLIKLLKQKNIDVENTLQNLKGKYQIDILAINGEEIVAVEVKTTLRLKDVDYFIEKLKNFKNTFPTYKNKRILGAIAYLKANEGSEKNSERKGLFVIRATGSSASIINAPDFTPRKF